ncbi:sodium:solute symporter family transporter [Bythopirellula polymerisocia]|uniref:Sodium/glucose cotransporter n=1 Tax=Bythopirellula polymerisocia TaxID=2528003 RepID=A0A5C6CS53_9BACT|nr:sodium/solute symporter [Bythopirellula polymerisocia]TWU27342.1 Sodium/glucose cotransporter [Bythopirellula polymerisocia]
MGGIDILVFVLFVASVIGIGLWKSKDEETSGEKGAQEYFLAGRGLTWWLVGFSLIAANISTEQFVGMSGEAADWLGMAIASYEWMAAITLVVVAFVFLPKFLKSGIYTIPEFLEYRYNTFARAVMAITTMVILVGVPTASVIFSGAKVISVFFQGQSLMGFDLGSISVGCWIIGVLAAAYVFAGGLKACAWADLIQGAALIVGGGIIAYLSLKAIGSADPQELLTTARNKEVSVDSLENAGPLQRFIDLNKGELPDGKLHMVRPLDDKKIPWSALIIGLWIPNFFYWGLNQYITQRTLGSKSLAEGQKGIIFAAFLKLVIPFVVVIPGILAFNLYSGDLKSLAEKKNAHLLTEFEAGSEKLIDFSDRFAETNPELAAKIVNHNATLLEETPLESDKQEVISIWGRNAELIEMSETSKIPVAGKLVGYDYDAAFPTLLKNLLVPGSGVLGFVLAAIFGAVVSSLASMLNSASTIFTMDIYYKLRKGASQSELVSIGRACTIAFVLIALLIAPNLGSPKFGNIFNYIQEFQGFISPGVLAIFIFGLLVHRAPRSVGTVGLILNPILYGALKLVAPQIAFLDRMAICFGILLVVLAIMTKLNPLPEPVELPVNESMNLEESGVAKFWGVVVVVLTIALYVVFF